MEDSWEGEDGCGRTWKDGCGSTDVEGRRQVVTKYGKTKPIPLLT